MNKQRRKALAEIKEKAEQLFQMLESLRDEEQDYYDNMPEGLQASARGEAAEAAISSLDGAVEGLGQCIDELEAVE